MRCYLYVECEKTELMETERRTVIVRGLGGLWSEGTKFQLKDDIIATATGDLVYSMATVADDTELRTC